MARFSACLDFGAGDTMMQLGLGKQGGWPRVAAAHELSQCALLPHALGLVLMQVQADRRISDETFASSAGMSVKDLRDVLRGELELPLGGYIKLAVAVGTPLGALLLEAERLAETLQAPSKNDDRRS